ncbi:MAG: DUF4363 family protein [Acutalibacteraceae bacterium]
MKINRLKVIAWLGAFLIIFCTAALVCTWYAQKEMHKVVDEARTVSISDMSSAEELERIKPMLKKIETKWEQYRPIVSTYSRHDEVERVTEEIEWLDPLYENGYYSQLNVKLVGINEALEHLMETEMPSIANIL